MYRDTTRHHILPEIKTGQDNHDNNISQVSIVTTPSVTTSRLRCHPRQETKRLCVQKSVKDNHSSQYKQNTH